jgi:hypothetical protein
MAGFMLLRRKKRRATEDPTVGAVWCAESDAPMDWKFNQAGQCEATNGSWNALVVRRERPDTWDAYVYLVVLPENRHTCSGFVEVVAALAWCEAEIKRLQALARRA